jgi:chromate transporter
MMANTDEIAAEALAGPEPDKAVRVPLPTLFATFLRIGTMTFGGSVQSWTHREIVERLGWLDNKSYLSGLTLAQVLPGANPVNTALYVGLQLRGGVGAAVAVFGMVVPAFCVILCLGYFYRSFGHLTVVHFILGGLAASGVGATLTMGIKVGKRLQRDLMAPLIAVAVFIVVGLLHWPMVPVVAAAVPVSIVWAYLLERRAARG